MSQHTPTLKPLSWTNAPFGQRGGENVRVIGAVVTEAEGCAPYMAYWGDEMKRRFESYEAMREALQMHAAASATLTIEAERDIREIADRLTSAALQSTEPGK